MHLLHAVLLVGFLSFSISIFCANYDNEMVEFSSLIPLQSDHKKIDTIISPLNTPIHSTSKPLYPSRLKAIGGRAAYAGAALNTALSLGSFGLFLASFADAHKNVNAFEAESLTGGIGAMVFPCVAFSCVKVGNYLKQNNFQPNEIVTITSPAAAWDLVSYCNSILTNTYATKSTLTKINSLNYIKFRLLAPCQQARISYRVSPAQHIPATDELFLQQWSIESAPLSSFNAPIEKKDLAWLLKKIVKKSNGISEFTIRWTPTSNGTTYTQDVTCRLRNGSQFTHACGDTWLDMNRDAHGHLYIPSEKWNVTTRWSKDQKYLQELIAVHKENVTESV